MCRCWSHKVPGEAGTGDPSRHEPLSRKPRFSRRHFAGMIFGEPSRCLPTSYPTTCTCRLRISPSLRRAVTGVHRQVRRTPSNPADVGQSVYIREGLVWDAQSSATMMGFSWATRRSMQIRQLAVRRRQLARIRLSLPIDSPPLSPLRLRVQMLGAVAQPSVSSCSHLVTRS